MLDSAAMARSLVAPWIGLWMAMALGCGGSAVTAAAVTSPFTDEHAQVFDNGLDLVRDPQALEGTWLSTWESDIDRRVGWSDVVALVTVRTLRTDLDLDRRQTYRLIARVDRVLYGENVGEELELRVQQGQAGYRSIEESERRLLDQQFLVFVKWADEEDSQQGHIVRARWHLSPATDGVANRARLMLTRRQDAEGQGDRRRVIVHRN